MAVKASFGNSSNNRNDNNNRSSNDDTNITTNNEDSNMHKEDSSPCWSSYWKFLQPQDEMWIVNDNARSHESRRLWNRRGSTSPDVHWDPTKDSVVGFCNAKTNRWGISPSSLASLGGDTSHTGTCSSTFSAATPTHQNNRNSSTQLQNCTTDPATRLSFESSSHSTALLLEDNDSLVRQDSLLMQPARRESLVLLDPIDLGLIRPERRVSEDSVLTFRTSIESSTMGTFESIVEDICDCSDLEGEDDNNADDDDDDDDDDDTYQNNVTISTRSTNDDNNEVNHTNDNELVVSSSNTFSSESCGTNSNHDSHNTKAPQHPDLQSPPMRHELEMAPEGSNSQQDGARRFAPMIRGTSLPNLDASMINKGPSVPVRRSSACSMTPAEVRSYFHQVHQGSSCNSSIPTRRPSMFEAILEYEPMEDLHRDGDQSVLSRPSTTSDDNDDDDIIDKRWIDAGGGTNGDDKAFTLVPIDSLRLARQESGTHPPTNKDITTNKEESRSCNDHVDGPPLEPTSSSSLLAPSNSEQLCVDEYDRSHSRRASYGPRRSLRLSTTSIASSSDQSSVAMPTRFLTKTDSVELGHVRLHHHNLGSKKHGILTKASSHSHSKDEEENGSNLPCDLPPLIAMLDDSSCDVFRNKSATSIMIGDDDEDEEQGAMPILGTATGLTSKMINRTTPNNDNET